MNKFALVLGVTAVVTLAGCRDPEFDGAKSDATAVKDVSTTPAQPAPTPAVAPQPVIVQTPVVPKGCTCPAGTKHAAPCACGAADCKCVVEVKPAVTVPPASPVYTTYIVQRGDSLSKISKRYNITIGSIKRLNGLKSDTVYIGRKLKLPGKVDVGVQSVPAPTPVVGAPKAKSAPAVKAYAGATKEYVVKNGDTLGAIAYTYGITVRQLRQLNGLQRDALQIGQKLKVPAEKVVKPATKSAAKVEAKADADKAVKPEGDADKAVKPEGDAETPVDAAADAVKPVDAAADAPAPADAAKAVETAQPKLNTYTVAEGDDITSVSIKWCVPAAEIRELNNLPEDAQLKPGQVLKLPAEAQL